MKKLRELLEKWLRGGYAPGTMGAAESKERKLWGVGASAIGLVLFSMVFFNLFATDLYKEMQKTVFVAKFFGVVGFLAGAYCHWYYIVKQDEIKRAEVKFWLLGVLLPFASLGLAISGGV